MREFQKVKSSNIDAVRYNAETAMLFVVFSGGKEYRYDGVSQNIFDGFMASESKGKYFHANIRNAFPAQFVSEETKET